MSLLVTVTYTGTAMMLVPIRSGPGSCPRACEDGGTDRADGAVDSQCLGEALDSTGGCAQEELGESVSSRCSEPGFGAFPVSSGNSRSPAWPVHGAGASRPPWKDVTWEASLPWNEREDSTGVMAAVRARRATYRRDGDPLRPLQAGARQRPGRGI